MLPETYQQAYTAFERSLEQFSGVFRDPNSPKPLIHKSFQAVQQSFQTVLDLGLDGLDPQQSTNAQSYYTEINKQLRLLGMDVMFLQASRQSATSTQRQQQMGERLERLRVYCEALLSEG
ncbi:heterocyst frequency control protein PatD [Egbenema bharatensis]|uniref:heterocyst frequency control protein PatD n=1 Tax=Egbenema bharatensis TaxID=3463334 RepID=UPI003A8A87A9